MHQLQDEWTADMNRGAQHEGSRRGFGRACRIRAVPPGGGAPLPDPGAGFDSGEDEALDAGLGARLSGDAARALGEAEQFADTRLPEDEEEALHFLQLLSALRRSRDEAEQADLREGLRRSAMEEYSGGFGVPPVDDSVLQSCTTSHTYFKTALEASDQCAICLLAYDQGDCLRRLECGHRFHAACVDRWLARSGQCPICKQPVGGPPSASGVRPAPLS